MKAAGAIREPPVSDRFDHERGHQAVVPAQSGGRDNEIHSLALNSMLVLVLGIAVISPVP